MNNPIPQEVLEAERTRIQKASQTKINLGAEGPSVPPDVLQRSIDKLGETFRSVVVQSSDNDFSRENKIREIKLHWSATQRHLKNAESIKPTQGPWATAFNRLFSKIGTGSTSALVGNRWTGKTQMAVMLMIEAANNLMSCKYCIGMDFFIDIKSTYGPNPAMSEKEGLKFYRRFKLLVIGEFDKRSDNRERSRKRQARSARGRPKRPGFFSGLIVRGQNDYRAKTPKRSLDGSPSSLLKAQLSGETDECGQELP